jgi:hypothetical protein
LAANLSVKKATTLETWRYAMVDEPEDEKAALAADATMVEDMVALAKKLPSVQSLPKGPKLDAALTDVIAMVLASEDGDDEVGEGDPAK